MKEGGLGNKNKIANMSTAELGSSKIASYMADVHRVTSHRFVQNIGVALTRTRPAIGEGRPLFSPISASGRAGLSQSSDDCVAPISRKMYIGFEGIEAAK